MTKMAPDPDSCSKNLLQNLVAVPFKNEENLIKKKHSLISEPKDQNQCNDILLPQDDPSSLAKDHWKPFSKLRVLKNLFVICLSFLFAFTAYEALMNLQSTINPVENVGTYSLAVCYASFCLSSLVLPNLIIDKIGCKMSLVISLFAFSPYIAANFYPGWWTFLPTAALCGMAAGPLWAARSTYINELSFQYTIHVKDSTAVITALFFGVACMSYQGAQIWGNLISYHVLKPRNETFVTHDVLDSCGAQFCNAEVDDNASLIHLNPNLEPPTEGQRYVLIAIFFVCSLSSAFILWIFLDDLRQKDDKKTPRNRLQLLTLLFATLKHLKTKKQILLLPLVFHIGLSDGFLFSDFTKAYIGCAWRIYHVGYVMMAYGTLSSLMSVVVAVFAKYFGRTIVFVSSGVVNIVTYIFLLLWIPNPDRPISFFLIAGAWGYTDAIWWGQLTALHGVLFKNNEEAAFSNFYFWSACGFLVAYAYERIFCTYVKIYILISFLAAGMIGYLTVECIASAETVKPAKAKCRKENVADQNSATKYSPELQI